MKKLSCFLVAMLFLLMPALQSCDDNDGYSIGQFGGSWATVRVLSGNTYYLDSDYYGTLWPAASNVYGFRPVDGQRLAVLFNPLYDICNIFIVQIICLGFLRFHALVVMLFLLR